MLVYDGLMLLPESVDLDDLAAAATEAASKACGCHMPTRFKEMKLPVAMEVILKQQEMIRERDNEIATLKRKKRDFFKKKNLDRNDVLQKTQLTTKSTNEC